MKLKINSGGFDEFKRLLEDFVDDNFNADGCKECHEVGHSIVPNDDNDYDNALKDLFIKLFGGLS